MMIEKTPAKKMWCIRAGKAGEAHDLFLENALIALADAGLGDLAKLEATRDAIYSAYRKLHPNDTRTGSSGIGGKFFRFVHEVQVGDLVVYPAVPNKTVYIGEVNGEYAFSKSSEFPHQRHVHWKYAIPRSEVSQLARYELGAARTFYEFKRNLPELMKKISGNAAERFAHRTAVDATKINARDSDAN